MRWHSLRTKVANLGGVVIFLFQRNLHVSHELELGTGDQKRPRCCQYNRGPAAPQHRDARGPSTDRKTSMAVSPRTSMAGRRDGRRGWTLLEVCTVLILLAALASLAVPGLQLLRESSRRSQCQSHMAGIGLALQNYHQAHGLLPPAVLRAGSSERFDLSTVNSRGVAHRQQSSGANWAVMLLPFRGAQALADSFDWSAAVMDPANAAPRSVELAMMKCPCDPHNNAANAYRLTSADGAIDALFARGNYGLNCGTSGLDHSPGKPWRPAPGGAAVKTLWVGNRLVEQQWGNGVGGVNKSYSVQDFKNGLSNLVGVDELRAGVVPADARGVWALGDAGSSMTWRHGLLGDAGGPNCPRHRADDTIGCNQAHEALGVEGLVAEGMTCCSYSEAAIQATARSAHPGGVNALIMDGSVRFIANDIDLSIWHAIHSNETRELPIPEVRVSPESALRPRPPPRSQNTSRKPTRRRRSPTASACAWCSCRRAIF